MYCSSTRLPVSCDYPTHLDPPRPTSCCDFGPGLPAVERGELPWIELGVVYASAPDSSELGIWDVIAALPAESIEGFEGW